MIILNGKKVRNPLSILKLIKEYGYSNNICIILNGKVIRKIYWDKVKLKDGDEVEIVGFVGGG